MSGADLCCQKAPLDGACVLSNSLLQVFAEGLLIDQQHCTEGSIGGTCLFLLLHARIQREIFKFNYINSADAGGSHSAPKVNNHNTTTFSIMLKLNQLFSHPGFPLHQPLEAPGYTTQLHVWAIKLRLPVYTRSKAFKWSHFS